MRQTRKNLRRGGRKKKGGDVEDEAKKAAGDLQDGARSVTGKLASAVNDGFYAAKGVVSDTSSAAKSAVNDGFDATKSVVSDTSSAAKSAASDARNSMRKIGGAGRRKKKGSRKHKRTRKKMRGRKTIRMRHNSRRLRKRSQRRGGSVNRTGGASRQQHMNDIFSASNHIINKNAEKAKNQLNKANTQFNKAFTNVLVATKTAAQTIGEKAAQGEVIDELKKTGKNIQSAINNVLAGKKPQQPRSV